MSTTMSREERVSTVFQTLEQARNVEAIIGLTTQLDSALEAAHIAQFHGADEETILAALLQDIGRYCPRPDNWEDRVNNPDAYSAVDDYEPGADYLRKFGFPKKTCELIESDMMAKCYIVATHPTLLGKFPETTSIWAVSLSPERMSELEKDPLFQQKVRIKMYKIRTWTNGSTPPRLDAYRDMAIRNMPI
ncbi:hypothetical protein H4R27_004048 [Coemansia aciculifera]|nr:hypothetical protein H4R27_004048 [Coemansia aciculifera]